MRFAVSPYKNALPTIPDRSLFYPDLPILAEGTPLLKPTADAIIATSASLGSLLLVDWVNDVGKPKSGENRRSPRQWNALGGKVTSLDAKDGLIAVGGQGGVNVWTLPSTPEALPTLHRSFPSPTIVSKVAFHPANPDVLLTSTNSSISIYDLHSDASDPRIQLEAFSPKGIWDVAFSWDGKLVGAVGKDGTVGVYDPRQKREALQVSAPLLNPLKQAFIVPFDDLFLVSGFSKSRERQILLFNPKDVSAPVASASIDYETAPLVPVADQERRIVYLAGRSENTLRHAEVSKTLGFTWGAVGIPSAVTSFALAPASRLDVMGGEINRLLIIDRNKEIVPVTIKVPKRHYIEFHYDIFPPIRPDYAAQSSADWFTGDDALPELISQDPAAKNERPASKIAEPRATAVVSEQPVASQSSPKVDTPASIQPATFNEAKEPSKVVQEKAPLAPSPTLSPVNKPVSQEPSKEPTPIPTSFQPSPIQPIQLTSTLPKPAPTPSYSEPARKPPAPTKWSRNFLQGTSPLVPTYDSLTHLSTTHPADSRLLQASSSYLFFPLAGSGGRLAIQPTKKKGRLPLVGDMSHFANGSDILDFELDLIGDGKRVAVASTDGKVHVWTVPEGLDEGQVVSEPDVVLDDKGIDKIAKVAWNPLVKDLLAVLSNGSGEGRLHLFNISTGTVIAERFIPGNGVWTAAWNAQGSLLAVACKDRQVRVFDPRRADETFSGPAHNSARSFQLVWLTDSVLATIGFAAGSQRKILVHSVPVGAEGERKENVEVVSEVLLDVSPSVLFPHYDPDTNILYLWGKGDTSISAFEIKLDGPKPTLSRLPTFSGPLQNAISFLPKQTVDVRKVEVAKGYRLTSRTIEEFSFKIPRKNTECFQDDVFVLTRDFGRSVGLEGWLGGKNEGVPLVDLRPLDMKLASEAPKIQTNLNRAKPQFGKRELTTAERAQASMDAMFARAKLEDEENKEVVPKGDEEWSD